MMMLPFAEFSSSISEEYECVASPSLALLVRLTSSI